MIYRLNPTKHFFAAVTYTATPDAVHYDGLIQLKKLTLSGQIGPANTYQSQITLEKIGLSGEYGSTGIALELKKLTVTGACDPLSSGELSIRLNKLTFIGTLGAEAPAYYADLRLNPLSLTGSLSPLPLYSATAVFKKLTLSANLVSAAAAGLSIHLNKLTISGAVAATAAYDGTIVLQKIQLAARILDEYAASTPDETVWVINLDTGGHWNYEDFSFNSLVRHNNEYYLASDSGVFILEKPAVPTRIGQIETPIYAFGGQYISYVPDIYLQSRGDADIILTAITDEADEYEYEESFRPCKEGRHVERIKLAKGAKGNNWQFRIQNVAGSRLDIGLIDVRPVRSTRSQ